MDNNKINIELTATEANLIVTFLEALGDKYSYAGCNDLKLDNTDDNWRMVCAIDKFNIPEEETERPTGPTIYTCDFLACSYLATVIENQIPTVPQEPNNA